MTIFLQQLINGLSVGSIFALIALGYTMVYGIIKLINFAGCLCGILRLNITWLGLFSNHAVSYGDLYGGRCLD